MADPSEDLVTGNVYTVLCALAVKFQSGNQHPRTSDTRRFDRSPPCRWMRTGWHTCCASGVACSRSKLETAQRSRLPVPFSGSTDQSMSSSVKL